MDIIRGKMKGNLSTSPQSSMWSFRLVYFSEQIGLQLPLMGWGNWSMKLVVVGLIAEDMRVCMLNS